MSDRIDVIAEKPLTLGGKAYAPGDRISMGPARVRQYELIAKRTGQATIRRDVVEEVAKPWPAPKPRVAVVQAPEPEKPTREAAVVHPEQSPRRYRNRRLTSED